MLKDNTTKAGSTARRSYMWLAWLGTALIVAGLASFLIWQPQIAKSMAMNYPTVKTPEYTVPENLDEGVMASLPDYKPAATEPVLIREPATHTEIRTQVRTQPIEYIVQEGDTPWQIVENFYADFISEPADVFRYLYSVYNNNPFLQDNSQNLKPGQTLLLPPVPGIWYKWTRSDTVQSVSERFSPYMWDPTVPEGFHVNPDDIVNFIGNNIDPNNPQIAPGTYVMIPGGAKPLVVVSLASAVSTTGMKRSPFNGPGACDFNQIAFGTGSFIWPSAVHFISGTRFMPGHWGIDLGSGLGSPIFASDGGTVSYAGWLDGGYGNLVVIDHGNGYSTLYEHLSSFNVRCGQAVSQGEMIGGAGSTGNSTGPHLHFEIQSGSGHIDPLSVLP